MKRLILAALALFTVCALPAAAAKPLASGPSLDLANGIQLSGYRSNWIEQQDDWPMPADPIINPTSCWWSVNDEASWFSNGALATGASTSATLCVVSDFNPVYSTAYGVTAWWHVAPYGFFGVSVDKPELDVSVCYQPQGRCFVPPASFCGRANYTPSDPALTDIVGSNGGRGVVTTITLTIVNRTAHRVRDITASWGISSDVVFPAGCETKPTTGEYPFTWSDG